MTEMQPRPLLTATTVVALLVCAVTLTVGIGVEQPHGGALVALGLLGVLMVASELTRHGLYDNGETNSTEAVAAIAAGIIAGPLAIPLLHGVVLLGGDLVRRRLRPATAINLGMLIVSALAAVAVYETSLSAGMDSSNWLSLAAGALAGMAYFVVNVVILVEIERAASGAPRRETLRGTGWLLPHYAAYGMLAAGIVVAQAEFGALGVVLLGMPTIAMVIATEQVVRRTERVVGELREANTTLEKLLGTNRGLLAALDRKHIGLIRGLARAIDAKDAYTAGHTERVASYAAALAEELGLDHETRRDIEHGALLHDIGKIGVSDAILSKPEPLSEPEWAEIRRHPETACFILQDIELPKAVLDVVRAHHENVDGTGYPDGIGGDELSVEARIARVADAFDAMTSTRPYRRALSVSAALAELRRCSMTQFCPRVVAAMEHVVERGVADRIAGTAPHGPLSVVRQAS